MRWLGLGLLLVACGAPRAVTDSGAADAAIDEVDAGSADAGTVDAGSKADQCASTFGTAFTNAFGRADGTIVAVVPPGWPCPLPNRDHVVVQVSMNGAVQRLVVNVLSTSGDPNIRLLQLTSPLPPPAFSEGWHPGLTLDYPSNLGVHSDDPAWESLDLPHATARISDALVVGAPISVYATSTGGATATARTSFIVMRTTTTAPSW